MDPHTLGCEARGPSEWRGARGDAVRIAAVLLLSLALVGCDPEWPGGPVGPPIVQPPTPPVDVDIRGPVRP